MFAVRAHALQAGDQTVAGADVTACPVVAGSTHSADLHAPHEMENKKVSHSVFMNKQFLGGRISDSLNL